MAPVPDSNNDDITSDGISRTQCSMKLQRKKVKARKQLQRKQSQHDNTPLYQEMLNDTEPSKVSDETTKAEKMNTINNQRSKKILLYSSKFKEDENKESLNELTEFLMTTSPTDFNVIEAPVNGKDRVGFVEEINEMDVDVDVDKKEENFIMKLWKNLFKKKGEKKVAIINEEDKIDNIALETDEPIPSKKLKGILKHKYETGLPENSSVQVTKTSTSKSANEIGEQRDTCMVMDTSATDLKETKKIVEAAKRKAEKDEKKRKAMEAKRKDIIDISQATEEGTFNKSKSEASSNQLKQTRNKKQYITKKGTDEEMSDGYVQSGDDLEDDMNGAYISKRKLHRTTSSLCIDLKDKQKSNVQEAISSHHLSMMEDQLDQWANQTAKLN